jgi:plastocyanin
MVHCPNGNQGAFVTPQQVTITVGDSIVWRMTGQVTSDTLVISLKDAEQRWPFGGAMPKGKASARTGEARVKGTYGYNVHLQCRLPGGGSEPVVIDPDIIID